MTTSRRRHSSDDIAIASADRDRDLPQLRTTATPALSGEYRCIAGRRTSSSAEWRAAPAARTPSRPAPAPQTFARRKSGATSAVRPGPARTPTPAPGPGCVRHHDAIELGAVRPASAAARHSSGERSAFDLDLDLRGGPTHLDRHAQSPAKDGEPSAVAPLPTPSTEVIPAPIGLGVVQRRATGDSPNPGRRELGRCSSSTRAAVDVHGALIAFAGFGHPPSSIWTAPAYAARVILRRRVLVRGLRRARAHGSPDVGVYEAALRTAENAAVLHGALLATLLAALGALLLYAGGRVVAAL